MAIGDVSLSSAARQNLASLQSTAKLLGTTQAHLSSGKKVNSALDNASSYFASQGFLNSANDLSNLKDGLSTSLQTVSAATNTLQSITAVVQQLQGITSAALQTTDTTVRNGLATQYDSLLTQLDGLVNDSTFNGTNLLSGTSSTLTVTFNATGSETLSITGVDATASGLSIAQASTLNNFTSNSDITSAASDLSTALSTLRTYASGFGGNNTIIQTRSTFTDNFINTLRTASDNLVLADTNEEGANLQALQAQSQLGVVALGISGQQAQAILRLF